MDDLLKPIKTTKKVQSNISKFESLSLKDSQQLKQDEAKPKRSIFEIDTTIEEDGPALKFESSKKLIKPIVIRESSSATQKRDNRRDSTAFLQHSYLKEAAPISLSDDAREILKSQPCHEDLKAVLEYLQYGIDGRHDFDIRITSPKSAQIISVLVAVTIPDIWSNLRQKELSVDEAQIKKTILACLTSAAGLGALLAQLRQYSVNGSDHSKKLLKIDTISVLAEILHGSKVLLSFLHQCLRLYSKDVQRRLFWQEISNLLAGGRALSTVAQALEGEDVSSPDMQSMKWLASGVDYSRWLGKNIVTAATELQTTDKNSWKFVCDIFRRGLSLGQREILVSDIYNSLLFKQRALWTPLHQLLKGLPPHDQKVVFDAILFHLNKNQLNEAKLIGDMNNTETRKVVSGAAALIAGIVNQNEVLEEYLDEWLVVANASYAAIGLASRRALIAVLAKSQDKLETILERSLTSFADKLRIQHGSILQQEAYTQTILLAIGCLRRIDPKTLKAPSISTLVMRSVSNRLAASIPRARLLGMLVGVTVSKIVDEPDKVLDFGIDELENDEAKQWLELSNVQDQISDISDLKFVYSHKQLKRSISKFTKTTVIPIKKAAPSHTSKIIAIEEVSDSSSEEDDPDLVPYDKPDTDAEDSDEDPTLINRSKPSAPVYIIDLIKYFNRTDQLDTIELALKTAPSLIKRKATFGTEVTDNVHALATSLINLQEGMSDPGLQSLRLESLIACIVAKPDTITPSFSTLYFEGDFSISQRVTLLSAIGLSAREISGFKDQDTTSSSSSLSQREQNQTEQDLFPSKRLPSHLLTPTSNPISTLTTQSSHSIIQPMAMNASEKLSGPSILKIRNFSSRPAVESRNKQKLEARTKIIPKNLSNLLTNAFYLPLCCRMSLLLSHANFGGANSNTTILQPDMVKMLLQTLVLIFHTLGPVGGSLHLPTLTRETVSLLMSLYTLPGLSTDPVVLPAMLHLLLVLVNITIEAGTTAQERLITEYGNQVAELVNWAGKLDERISVPDVNDRNGGMSWSVLAAGIQVKWFEMGQRFQGRMLGLMGGEFDGF